PLPLAPGYRIVSPPHSGSRVGKGKLAHAISIVAFGKKINAAALGERKEEFDKGLTDKLLSGEQSILFDNLNNQTLRSRLLCVVLGESDADLRRLGAGMETARPASGRVSNSRKILSPASLRANLMQNANTPNSAASPATFSLTSPDSGPNSYGLHSSFGAGAGKPNPNPKALRRSVGSSYGRHGFAIRW